MKKKSIWILVVMFLSVTAFSSGDAQIFKTALKITVIDELGNIVPGASVQLFKSEKDYKGETNAATKKMVTDKKGKITFKELKPIIYYVNVEKGDKNNYGAGVQTDKLLEGKLNKVNIVIE